MNNFMTLSQEHQSHFSLLLFQLLIIFHHLLKTIAFPTITDGNFNLN